jgi:hypothetical protein
MLLTHSGSSPVPDDKNAALAFRHLYRIALVTGYWRRIGKQTAKKPKRRTLLPRHCLLVNLSRLNTSLPQENQLAKLILGHLTLVPCIRQTRRSNQSSNWNRVEKKYGHWYITTLNNLFLVAYFIFPNKNAQAS